jgi:hypothetical protein
MLNTLINSWTLGAMAAVGLLIVGRKKTWGWLFLVAVQTMWIIYGVTTGQYGFIASGVGFALLNGWNWVKWRRADRAAQAARSDQLTHPRSTPDPALPAR